MEKRQIICLCQVIYVDMSEYSKFQMIDIWGQIILILYAQSNLDCPVHYRVPSLPGLYPLDTSNIPLSLPHCDNQQCLPTLTNVSTKAKSLTLCPPLGTTHLDQVMSCKVNVWLSKCASREFSATREFFAVIIASNLQNIQIMPPAAY